MTARDFLAAELAAANAQLAIATADGESARAAGAAARADWYRAEQIAPSEEWDGIRAKYGAITREADRLVSDRYSDERLWRGRVEWIEEMMERAPTGGER